MLHPYDDTVHLSVGAKTLDAQRSVLATTCQFFNDLVASEAAEGAGALVRLFQQVLMIEELSFIIAAHIN